MNRRTIAAGVILGILLAATPAFAHPHVFAESRMEIVGTAEGRLAAVRNIWRMDELFSSSVLFDFDKNANGALDPEELEAIGTVIRESVAEWDFYTFVTQGGRGVALNPPDEIRALYEDGQLILFFEMLAGEAVDLKSTAVTFSTFDDSFFVAFDFADENAFELFDWPAGCSKSFIVPNPDEAAARWMDQIATLGPDESVPEDGIVYSEVLAPRLEVACG